MTLANYAPAVFDVSNIPSAKRIILTDEPGACSEDRWQTETPYLVGLMSEMGIGEGSIVLDYGCGIGRLSKALIQKYGCRVIGADISRNMRTLAIQYVDSDRFVACHPEMIDVLGVKFDAALAVWVIQHCFNPADDLARIHGAMKSAGQFFIVNEHYRCVPTNHGWASDSKDVRALTAAAGFEQIQTGAMDMMQTGRNQAPYWARYVRQD